MNNFACAAGIFCQSWFAPDIAGHTNYPSQTQPVYIQQYTENLRLKTFDLFLCKDDLCVPTETEPDIYDGGR